MADTNVVPLYHGTIGNRAMMATLARTFPTLRREAPIDPFDPEVLESFARGGACHSALVSARFVLSVWSGTTGALDVGKKVADRQWPWKCARFDLHEAFGVWDDEHRAAFLAWARAPWWP